MLIRKDNDVLLYILYIVSVLLWDGGKYKENEYLDVLFIFFINF